MDIEGPTTDRCRSDFSENETVFQLLGKSRDWSHDTIVPWGGLIKDIKLKSIIVILYIKNYAKYNLSKAQAM